MSADNASKKVNCLKPMLLAELFVLNDIKMQKFLNIKSILNPIKFETKKRIVDEKTIFHEFVQL